MIRPLVLLLGLLATFGWAPAALAQGQDPLSGCTTGGIHHTGPLSFDPDTKTWSISGAVRVECDGTSIFAETITWNDRTVFASGNLLVTQDGLRVNADRVEMDRQTRLGTFYNAYGTARLTDEAPDGSGFGSMEPEIMFDAEKLERIGPRSYRLTHGRFSTCVQPTPRWEMTGSSGTIVLDEYALLKNVSLRVKGLPVLYVPYLYYPLKKDRATGFLLPVYTASGVRGQGLSNAFFWAIGRSQDATFYHDWFSKTGQGAAAEYRYVAGPGSGGNVNVQMLFAKQRLAADGTVELPASRSFTIQGSVNQSLGRYFRLYGNANYFNDVTSQQLYQQNVLDLSNRTRYLGLTLSGNVRRLRVNAKVEQNDLFTGTVSQGRSVMPQVNAWLSERAIGRSGITFGASGEVAHFQVRDQNQTQTQSSVRRLDGLATLRAPLSPLPYLSVMTTASWRTTRWLDSLDPVTRLPVSVPITRNLLDLRADIGGPNFFKVYRTPNNGYAEGFKHLIEPRLTVQWLSPFDRRADVIQMDYTDQLVGGTTSVTYSLGNRVLAKVRTAGGISRQRQFLFVGIGQTYYSNAAAGAIDPQYSTPTIGTFSPIQIDASIRPTDEVSGNFRLSISSVAKAVQTYSASTSLDLPRVGLSAGWSKRQYLPGVPGYDDPNGASHFLNANATVRTLSGRAGATYDFHFDVKNTRFVQQHIRAYYGAQCCGISFDYQTINISQFQLSGIGADRRFAVSFTLGGIGSFPIPLSGLGR